MQKLPKLLVFALSYNVLFALPMGMEVVSGEISSQSLKGALEITASDRSVLHWDSFSIDENESLTFLLPHSDAFTLNRGQLFQQYLFGYPPHHNGFSLHLC